MSYLNRDQEDKVGVQKVYNKVEVMSWQSDLLPADWSRESKVDPVKSYKGC